MSAAGKKGADTFRLGVVEGFYGRPWSWAERRMMAGFMADHGYSFYLYAPKGDLHLRRKWREAWPKDILTDLQAMTRDFHLKGLRVGMGLSPHEFHDDREKEAITALDRKMDEIESLGVDHVSLLFDDMKGDVPGLVQKQVKLAHHLRNRHPRLQLSLCPTYYSYDPILERLFGKRPPTYLSELGQELDPSIEIFWTGEKICSKSYTVQHLKEVEAILKRPVLLWDNYPVNDTENMSRFLHLRAFENRPAEMREHLSGHLVNPMLQPVLSQIPMLTLVDSYNQGAAYRPTRSFSMACESVAGHSEAGRNLARMIERDLALFQDQGIHQLSEEQIAGLRAEYRKVTEHPAAREVLGWLDGIFRVTREQIIAQQ